MPMLEAGAAMEAATCSVTQACPGLRGVVRHCMPTTSVGGREVDTALSLTLLQSAVAGLSLRADGPRQCQPPGPGEPPRRAPLFVGSRDALDRTASTAPWLASAAMLCGTTMSEGLLDWGRRWLLSLPVSAAAKATTTWAGLPALEGERLCRSGDVRVVVVAAPVPPRADPSAGEVIGSARTGDKTPPFDFGVAAGEFSRHAGGMPPT
mmetsp:Transcript_57054/g.113427  ORF Transcript_57054/g.113427 Transcript_57054/m.113427 type:complete len:208 (-) Transcript_57054:913-1536(-)